MQTSNYLLVTTKDGSIIGKLREKDGISDCKLTEKQNDNSTLTFNMLTSSEKYTWLADPENLIVADERVFSAIYDGDSLTEKKDSGNKNTAAFSFVERQCLLDKIRVTAYNSTTTYDHIDEGMVIILSGGIYPLTVNGIQLSCPYAQGTAAYALYAVLYGTGWSVSTVDVDGTFDLETDKKSVLENVKAIQSLWGGILMFDSLKKKVHLRSEEIYRPYNGYGVRFRFNETGLERSVNRNIITRLYVYGKDNLNIAASNGGKITAKEGCIGSWQILDGGIINENNALALTSKGEIIAAGGNFSVDTLGFLTANGAKITGYFSASSKSSTVVFSDEDMYISFVGVNEDTGLIETACMISPEEFYFVCYGEDEETVKSGIMYSDGELEITGKITADSGEIGGWLIEDDKIKAQNGSMVLYADGTIEGCDGSGDSQGKIISQTNDERTVIVGGRINMYKRNTELNDGNGGWEREGAVYTNVNADGGIYCSAENRKNYCAKAVHFFKSFPIGYFMS